MFDQICGLEILPVNAKTATKKSTPSQIRNTTRQRAWCKTLHSRTSGTPWSTSRSPSAADYCPPPPDHPPCSWWWSARPACPRLDTLHRAGPSSAGTCILCPWVGCPGSRKSGAVTHRLRWTASVGCWAWTGWPWWWRSAWSWWRRRSSRCSCARGRRRSGTGASRSWRCGPARSPRRAWPGPTRRSRTCVAARADSPAKNRNQFYQKRVKKFKFIRPTFKMSSAVVLTSWKSIFFPLEDNFQKSRKESHFFTQGTKLVEVSTISGMLLWKEDHPLAKLLM